MERRSHHTAYDLLQQERFTPEEVAELLGIGVHIIQHAAFTGELRAEIVGHHILRLRRDDLLVWLGTREGLRRDDASEAVPEPRAMGEHRGV